MNPNLKKGTIPVYFNPASLRETIIALKSVPASKMREAANAPDVMSKFRVLAERHAIKKHIRTLNLVAATERFVKA